MTEIDHYPALRRFVDDLDEAVVESVNSLNSVASFGTTINSCRDPITLGDLRGDRRFINQAVGRQLCWYFLLGHPFTNQFSFVGWSHTIKRGVSVAAIAREYKRDRKTVQSGANSFFEKLTRRGLEHVIAASEVEGALAEKFGPWRTLMPLDERRAA